MEDISKLRQYASILMQERKKLEGKILRAKPYIEGSLIKRFTRCGKPGCRCMKANPTAHSGTCPGVSRVRPGILTSPKIKRKR